MDNDHDLADFREWCERQNAKLFPASAPNLFQAAHAALPLLLRRLEAAFQRPAQHQSAPGEGAAARAPLFEAYGVWKFKSGGLEDTGQQLGQSDPSVWLILKQNIKGALKRLFG